MPLLANSRIIIQIHYPQNTSGQQDSTSINFKLTSNTLRPFYMDAVLNHATNITNGPLIILPNQTKTFYEAYTVPADVTALNVAPHMHLIGKSMKVYGITPIGDTLKFVDLPNWDFHWQGAYDFRKLVKIPANTVLHAEAFYDNTSANPDNPNNPPALVTAGEATTDEMMLSFFTYTYYLPGDENIAIDNSNLIDISEEVAPPPTTSSAFEIYPSPCHDQLTIIWKTPANTITELPLEIYNSNGQLIFKTTITESNIAQKLSVYHLNSGNYFLKAGNQTHSFTKL
jgi:hypothetical protein